jgi:DNA-binding NarL/FixJ family response regulator
MITVMLVDDHAIVRTGLTQLFSTVADIEVVAEAGDGAEAVSQMAAKLPQVILMDLAMPGMDGIEATRQIMAGWPSTRVVGLTSYSDRKRVLAMLDAGACGYLLKESDPLDLVRGIRAAAAGESPLAPIAAAALLNARVDGAPFAELTQREREVLEALGDGLSNRRIGTRLGISEATVKGHLTKIYQALGVSDRMTAAMRAREMGLDTNPR